MERFLEIWRTADSTRREVQLLAAKSPSIVNEYSLANGCAIASSIFYKVLKRKGVRCSLVYGKTYGTPHFWVVAGHFIWDITHTQFSHTSPEVYVIPPNEHYAPLKTTHKALKEARFYNCGYSQSTLDSLAEKIYKRLNSQHPKGNNSED